MNEFFSTNSFQELRRDSKCSGIAFSLLIRPRSIFVVISGSCWVDPVLKPDVANLSTTPCPSGETCTVNPNEHDKLSHLSYLRFDNVRVAKAVEIEKLLATNNCFSTTEASAKLLEKMQRAVRGSKVVPQEAIAIISASLPTAESNPAQVALPPMQVRKRKE